MKRRYKVIGIGVLALLVGVVWRHITKFEADTWRELPRSVLQDVTKESIVHFVRRLLDEPVVFEIYIITDGRVAWESLVHDLPKFANISYKKGWKDMSMPLEADPPIIRRILTVEPLEWPQGRIKVSVAWIASSMGMTFFTFTLEKQSEGWKVIVEDKSKAVVRLQGAENGGMSSRNTSKGAKSKRPAGRGHALRACCPKGDFV